MACQTRQGAELPAVKCHQRLPVGAAPPTAAGQPGSFDRGPARAATRAAGNTVSPESVPPLELPTEHPRTDGWRRRWLVPAAAAAAVVVVVIAVTAVTVGPATRTPAPAIAPGGAVTGPMPPGPSLASYVSS